MKTPATTAHLLSIYWSKEQASVGENIALTANLIDVPDGNEIVFVISSYNGSSPRLGSTTEKIDTVRLVAKARAGIATVTWKVSLNPNCFAYADLPTFRFCACLRSEISRGSAPLTIGTITAVEWIDPILGSPRMGDKTTQAYFKNSDSVTIRVKAIGLHGFRVHFVVSFKNNIVRQGDWPPCWNKESVLLLNGEATAVFRIAKSDFEKFGFGSFRCDIALSYGCNRIIPRVFRSGIARHYATRIGIWGLDPSAPSITNNTISLIAKAIGAVAVGHFSSATAKILAYQIAPHENDIRVFGYDRGSISLILLARELDKRGIGITLAIAIDLLSRRDSEEIPENVSTIFCFYQRNGARTSKLRANLDRGVPIERTDSSHRGIISEQLRRWGGFAIFHEDVPEYVFLHRNVEAMLRASLVDLDKVVDDTIMLQKNAALTESDEPEDAKKWQARR